MTRDLLEIGQMKRTMNANSDRNAFVTLQTGYVELKFFVSMSYHSTALQANERGETTGGKRVKIQPASQIWVYESEKKTFFAEIEDLHLHCP